MNADFSKLLQYNGELSFSTVRILKKREGLSIMITWPKGHVQKPGNVQAILWSMGRNQTLLIVIGGLLLLLLSSILFITKFRKK
jgi:hypothetical protein